MSIDLSSSFLDSIEFNSIQEDDNAFSIDPDEIQKLPDYLYRENHVPDEVLKSKV